MISKNIYKYCSEDISKIENFEQAANDTTQIWALHHRKETDENKTRKQLIDEGLYYSRPADELIFLTKAEHNSLHFKNKQLSDTHKDKISTSRIGHVMSEETKEKLSKAMSGENNPMFGRQQSEDGRRRISEARKHRGSPELLGRHLSEETKEKIRQKAKARLANPENHPMYGRHHSEESKAKNAKSHHGKTPWNKGMSQE